MYIKQPTRVHTPTRCTPVTTVSLGPDFADRYQSLPVEVQLYVLDTLALAPRHRDVNHINCSTWKRCSFVFTHHFLYLYRLGPDFSKFAREAFYKANTITLLPSHRSTIARPPASAIRYIRRLSIEVALAPSHWHQLHRLATRWAFQGLIYMTLRVRPILPNYDATKPFLHNLTHEISDLVRLYTDALEIFLATSFPTGM